MLNVHKEDLSDKYQNFIMLTDNRIGKDLSVISYLYLFIACILFVNCVIVM